jgi:acyl carrier protein
MSVMNAPWSGERRGAHDNGAAMAGAAQLRGAARCRIVAALITRKFPMSPHTDAERELAELLVESLNLEDVAPDAIDPEAPLFNTGLGLDSIDALELALAISKRYGFQLRSDNDDNRRIFGSLRALATHVQQHKTV